MRFGVLAFLCLAGWGCGDDDGHRCGPGTVLEGDTCVAAEGDGDADADADADGDGDGDADADADADGDGDADGDADGDGDGNCAEPTDWVVETIDDTHHTGYHASLAIDGAGGVHITYGDNTTLLVRYAPGCS